MSNPAGNTAVPSPADGQPTDAPHDSDLPEDGRDLPGCGPAPAEAMPPRPMMRTGELTAHPGKVRTDLDLNPEFLASVEANGVLTPLRITVHRDGGTETYRVIDGHRRLAAALKTGVAEIPCDMVSERSGDAAGQFLDMYSAGRHGNPLTVLEQADALFGAEQAGATRTRIRKSTGLKAAQVKTMLTAAALTADTRASVAEVTRERGEQLSLGDLAILAEFQDDPEACGQLLSLAEYHDGLEHQAERLRQKQAERIAQEKLRAELEASGLTITDDVPPGGIRLAFLKHDGEELTPEAHAGCPARGVFFYTWDRGNPIHYCADPVTYGHQLPEEDTPAADQSPQSAASLDLAGAGTPASGSPGPLDSQAALAAARAREAELAEARRTTIEGNKAWRAAATVRHRWLAGLLAGRSAPREVDVFVAQQLLAIPEPVRRFLPPALQAKVFTTITGKHADQVSKACGTAAARKLPLLMLAPIAGAYEQALTQAAGGQDTWQRTRLSPCPYTDAGAYFTFLASIGYQLSIIERAVADGTDWTPGASLSEVFAEEASKPDCTADLGADEITPDETPAKGPDVPSEASPSQEQIAA